MLSLFQQTEKYLLKDLARLPPQDLIKQYENLATLFDVARPSKDDIFKAKLLRSELVRRLQTGWKIALIYNVFSLQPDRISILVDDPGIKRAWQTSRFGYMKRNEIFLQETQLALVELLGQQDETSRHIGNYLLSKAGQRVSLNFTTLRGPVIPNQNLFGGSTTNQVVFLSVDNVNLPAPVFESPELYSVAATVEVTVEAQAYIDMIQQLDSNIYIQ